MNAVADEIMAVVNDGPDDHLKHYGIKRRSGRYPWGSGDDPYQHSSDLIGRVETLKKKGMSEKDIANTLGMTTTKLRSELSTAKNERRALDVARAKSLKEDGKGATEIARIMSEEQGKHISESTIRSFLNADSEKKMNLARQTAEILKKQIDEKGMIDVGTGVELELGVSKEKLKQALDILQEEGYPVYKGGIPQATNPGKQTNQRVICPPGTEHKEIYNYENIHSIKEYMSKDGGVTFEKKFHYPTSVDSKRVMIRYKEDGGIDMDGVIELRRGVDDLSLGNSKYAQVRILVDGTHYLKGMAVYADDLPDGVDIRFNTNKTKDKPLHEVLKKIKDDPENPFGSAIKDVEKGGQYWYIDKNGKKQLGAINKRADQGDWTEWKDKLPSQFLSKQSIQMAKKQLGLAIADKEAEYDEICKLTNPTVKKNRLQAFAEDCDSAAVHLQAAALPGQKYHVIIPNNTLKENEIYAPGYPPGTQLALIRYPHGGTFEIPMCTVVKSNKVGEKLIGKNSIDAVCINARVAERLSGADFDGDTVMCIPTHDKAGKVKITSTQPLKGLEGFDSKSYQYDKHIPANESKDGKEHYYKNGKEFKIMKNTGTQMGIVSNLITDMTLKGAEPDELAAAVRHSMVVIDAEKHKLDYKQSEIDNNIAALKEKYQGYTDSKGKYHKGGASTLLSRSKGETTVDKRQGSPKVNLKGTPDYDPTRPEGALIWKTADNVEYQVTRTNKRTGETTTITKRRTQASTKMAETDDARTLISDRNTPMERAYADYANKMKSMANSARVEAAHTGKIAVNANAKRVYAEEVKSLDKKLERALLNAPRERQAQLLANAEVNAKKRNNPNMKPDEIKKAGQQALSKYREAVGAHRQSIDISDKEWEAIQAGAISENKLTKILNNSDKERLSQLATPRNITTPSKAKVNKIKAMNNSNYSLAEIAKAVGLSTSTVSKYINS